MKKSYQEESFELLLSREVKVLLLVVGSFLLLACVCNELSDVLKDLIGFSEKERRQWLIAMMIVGAYGLYRALKPVITEPTLVTVKADRLLVFDHKAGTEDEVLFDSIAAYRFIDFNHQATLRLKLRDGRKKKLQAHDMLHPAQNFAGMVGAFEAALSRHHGPTAAAATVREKTLFEKPVSTVLLVAFAGLMVWMTWAQHAHHRHVSGSLFSLWGIFSAYLVAWLAAAKRRQLPA